ncbi:arginine ABC transporter ATP-binding protein ArtP [Utexia brackfieldae]|uniref:arginine ABC transporter ATP-binding protein ArtP n=1 Tax=Utexia brackfieldae TaxID=3074108 RepID=UPI00370D77E8
MNIALNQINCFYGQHQALFDINVSYDTSETIVLLGPSGAGKSSLLKVFNLLEKPTSGKMTIANTTYDFTQPIADDKISRLRKNVGMVFQNYNLWPHLTVMENLIEAPCQVLGMQKTIAKQKAAGLLARLHLSGFDDRFPLHLSGGQQQRVAIARALMMEPQILLFDEPTAALDPEITSQVADIINELSVSGITQIIVTHEVDFAKKVASKVIYMENGHIIEQGDASCLSSPKTAQLKAYLSH